MEKAQLDSLIVAHGDELHTISRFGVDIVLRGPTAAELDRFLELGQETANKTQAAVDLVTTCVVFPAKAEFESLRQRKPGILYGEHGLLTQVQKIAGMAEVSDAKKVSRA